MSATKKKVCPEINLIEAYVSNQIASPSERKKVSHHIYSCRRCLALATELNQYYKILEQEKKKPVSSSIFKLIHDIEKENVVIAGILLQPTDEPETIQLLKYQAEIVLLTEKDHTTAIDDIDCIPIDDNEIFVRAIQYQDTYKTTLYLYANDEKLYRNVQFQIKPGVETFLSDHIGKIELGQFDIVNLDNQHITIKPCGICPVSSRFSFRNEIIF